MTTTLRIALQEVSFALSAYSMPNTRQDSSAVPPCAVTDDEVAEGLRLLDAAIEVADQHVR